MRLGLRTAWVAVLALALVALPLGGPAKAALAGPFTFNAYIGYCFGGKGPPNTLVTITWRKVNRALKSSFAASTGDQGYWSVPDPVCAAHRVELRDTIHAETTSPPAVRTFHVRPITVFLDRQTNLVTGEAPAYPRWTSSSRGRLLDSRSATT